MKNLITCFAVIAVFNVSAQSRWNNYFVAHFEAPGSPSSNLVDSLASELGMHSTYQIPYIGGGQGSIAFPYEVHDIRIPLAFMMEPNSSFVEKGRLVALGNSNSGVSSGVFDVVVYEPVYSSQLSWLHFSPWQLTASTQITIMLICLIKKLLNRH